MTYRITFDAPSVPTSDALSQKAFRVTFDNESEFIAVNTGSAIQATIFGGLPGPRGPAGVVVIDSTEEFPPVGTPAGTIVYQRV